MTQTSLGGVSNSASKVFTNPKGNIALVNYGRVTGSISQYDFDAINTNNQITNISTNISNNNNNNTNYTAVSNQTWSGTYNNNIIW